MYGPFMRGEQGELCLVEKQQNDGSSEEQPESSRPTSETSSPGSSVSCHVEEKIYRNWPDLQKGACSTASPAAGPPLQDDIDGQVFVSFPSKKALQVHSGDTPASSTPPVSIATQSPTVEAPAETDEERIGRYSALLLQDLRVLKHRQVIHPVLQEVGMKLSSLDPLVSIDLRYLGVQLPIPPPNQSSAGSPDEGVPFISRTGKTSDMTKIKGWRNKFTASKETSPSSTDGPQKNLSAFCSNMLDEYLESEAQYMSERASAFSSSPVDPVAYQLPVKSSSYVKTLDSVLKRGTPAPKEAPKVEVVADSPRPIPLPHKSPGRSTPTAPPQAAVPQFRSGNNAAADDFIPPSQRSAPGQRQIRPPGVSKSHMKFLQMESRALNQGLGKTQLTTDRVAVALSMMLTKQMLPSQVQRVSQCRGEPPLCGQDFCVLGCVCSSLDGGRPIHCRQPGCMFGCDCSNSVPNQDHVSQPHPGSHARKLWDGSVDLPDPEPLFAPKSFPVPLSPVRQSSSSRPVQPVRVQEVDKGPVYKYFESMMTCARVRPFESKPPPQGTSKPNVPETPRPKSTEKPGEESPDSKPKTYFRTQTEHLARCRSIPHKAGLRKQMEIQSLCEWHNDRKRVVESLTRRMFQDKLPRRFPLGPYRVCLVSKTFLKKPSGSTLIYKVRLSKPPEGQNLPDEDDDESEDEDPHELVEEELEEMHIGLTPFLRGVQPAGIMSARTKPAGCQTPGPVQVNGKSYNRVQLLLGIMGSLHPANRLAAYVTGRLKTPPGISLKKTPNPVSSHSTPSTSGALHMQATAAAAAAPLVVKTKPPTKQKTLPQATAALMSMLASRMKAVQDSKSSGPTPLPVLRPGPYLSTSHLQRSYPSSAVSLTVSPSMKTPSFINHSGTCTFRICPPTDQAGKEQKQAGVKLPGGFMLMQLPTHPPGGGDAEQPEAAKPPNNNNNNAPPPKTALSASGCLAAAASANSPDWTNYVKSVLSSKSPEPASSEEEESPDLDSEDDFFSYSDSDDGSDESDVDVEEDGQSTMTQMQQFVRNALEGTSVLKTNLGTEGGSVNQSTGTRRWKDVRLKQERQRRLELRMLFDRLVVLVKADAKASSLHVLQLALKEIQSEVARSKQLAEMEKDQIRMQAIYLKQLALLTGKSPQDIACKAKEICAKQKAREEMMKSKPFSNLLRSRAVLLQNAPQQAKPTLHLAKPQSQAPPHTPSASAWKGPNQQQTPSRPAQLQLLSLLKRAAQATASSPQARTQPGNPAATALRVTSAQDGVSSVPTSSTRVSAAPVSSTPVSSTPTSSTPTSSTPTSSTPTSSGSPVLTSLAPKASASPIALPVIRTKDGRLILPSSMKPLNQGLYTLMLVDEKKNGETQDGGPDSESGAEKVPAQPTKAILVPLKLLEKSKEAGTAKGLNLAQGNVCLRFKPVPRESAKAESEAVPDVARRGRPRKVLRSPEKECEGSTASTDPERKESSAVVDSNISHKIIKAMIDSTKTGDPEPVKRPRGRPPKRRSSELSAPRDRRASSSSEERLVFSVRVRSPDTREGDATSRPLTRASLGKDFPSAKKRSWIDLEKELEPELDSE